MSISYDAKLTSPDKLAKLITGLGYKVERIKTSTSKKSSAASRKSASSKKAPRPKLAPVPKKAPKFFIDAMTKARRQGRPVILDFWATWCAPCIALKKKTLEAADVAKALASVEVIFVDLDKHPELAKVYGVTSIPDVFFIDARGFVVDRLREFEAAAPFLRRVKKLLKR